jgi:hypothetical protein
LVFCYSWAGSIQTSIIHSNLKNLLLVLLVLSTGTHSHAQDITSNTRSREAKNGIVLSAGSVLLVSNVSASYERKLTTLGAAGESSLWAKARSSWFSGYISSDRELYLDAALFALLGSGRSFTELSLGVGVFSVRPEVYPVGSVGYRFQKKEGGIIFRTGAGYPELFYLGLGYSF